VLVGSSYRLRHRQRRSLSPGCVCTRQKVGETERVDVSGITESERIEKSQKDGTVDRARGRTWNLLITHVNRSQAPCHWATRPSTSLIDESHIIFRVYIEMSFSHYGSLRWRFGILCSCRRKNNRPRLVRLPITNTSPPCLRYRAASRPTDK
jgi:hypothetical protein